MSAITLAASGVIYVASSAVFFGISLGFAKRKVSPDLKIAAAMFVVFWASMAGVILLSGAENLLVAFGLTDIALHEAIGQLDMLLLTTALVGLMYYMLVFVTGRKDLLLPVAAFYAWLFLVLLYTMDAAHPKALTVTAWSAWAEYAPTSMPLLVAMSALFIVPPIVACLMFLGASLKLHDPGQRSRMAIVSIGILVWAGGGSYAAMAENAWLSFILGPGLSAVVAIGWFVTFRSTFRGVAEVVEEAPIEARLLVR